MYKFYNKFDENFMFLNDIENALVRFSKIINIEVFVMYKKYILTGYL